MKWLKIGGIAIGAAGTALSFISDLIAKKNAVADLAASKEIKDLMAKEVAKALEKKGS